MWPTWQHALVEIKDGQLHMDAFTAGLHSSYSLFLILLLEWSGVVDHICDIFEVNGLTVAFNQLGGH